VVVALGVFFLFSMLVAHYFKIQILEADKWIAQAHSQHEFIVKEPFKRGTFYSNTAIEKHHPHKLQPLVMDVTKFHLYLDPLSIPEACRQEVAETLTALAPMQVNLQQELSRKSRSRRVSMWLDREEKEQIQSFWMPFAKAHKIPRNALYFVTDYQRSYPFGPLLGQVLHTIREIKDEATSEGLPTGGLEAYFNQVLKGKMGKRKLLRSPLNHLEIDQVIEAPEDGADVHLTINHCIQAIVEEELEKGVRAAQAKGGWAVMMDPVSGEIMALAQYPFFYPAHYQEYFNDPEKITDTKVKAVTDAFELGSIMKPITLAIGLKANEELKREGKPILFDPQEKLDATRTIFPGRAHRPLKDGQNNTALNLNMALQKSSNIYMAQVIDRVVNIFGNKWYRNVLVDTFGFGQKTEIELPAEASGLVPLPGKCYPNGALQWSLPTPYSLSIGYNILATSLQMLRAYAVFGNGGYLPTPTLVKKIIKEGRVEEHLQKPFPKVLSDEIVLEILTAMKYTTKPGGTGHLAEVSGYTEGGKTATAEKIINGAYSKQTHISSFIGLAPLSLVQVPAARFVLIVTIDEPETGFLEGGGKNHMGGRCAAPVFREISKRTLEFLGVTPDDPYGYPVGDPRYNPEKADWVNEVQQLKTLYEEWNR